MTDTRPALTATQNARGFNAAQGFEIVEWSPGAVQTRVTASEDQHNSQGLVHGGVLCAFMDFACGLVGIHPDDEPHAPSCMTLSLTTNFLAPGRDGTLYCRARRTGGGYAIYYAEAQIEDATGTPVATAIGTFKYNRKPAPTPARETD